MFALTVETRLPAPDFPEGFIYWGIGIDPNPVIGASGHIAFSGEADVSLGSTENKTSAVWAGLPGQLRAIVRENEPVNGFPSNVLFDAARPARNLGGFVVTPSGAVGIPAIMKGAVATRALLAHVNGTTIGILRNGEPAPGFPAGTLITGSMSFAMSDAGMVITASATLSTLTGTLGETGIWLHDFNTITRLPSPVPGCRFAPLTVSINQAGVVTLGAGFVDDGRLCTPAAGIFKWQNGQWQTVMAQDSFEPGGGEVVPGMAQAEFNLTPTFLFSSPRHMTDDRGNVAFSSSLRNPLSITQNKASFWYRAEGEEPRLIALAEETLPGDPNAIIARLSFLSFSGSSVSNNGASVVPLVLTNRESVLLSGFPRASQPYSSLQDTGEIQLSVTARQNRRPPGFDQTWFYSQFLGQALNRNGDFIFSAFVQDAVSPRTSIVNAIWRAQVGGEPRLRAMTGMKINANGQERFFRRIFPVGNGQSNTNGTPSQFSDTGDFVFAGEVDGSVRSILLIPDDQREQRIFALAEQLFPQFFAPANAEDRLLEGFDYCFYSGTETYIGIKGDEVFVLGAPFGEGIVRIGTIDETLAFLEQESIVR